MRILVKQYELLKIFCTICFVYFYEKKKSMKILYS
jgi:hypothetical protein